MNANRGYYDIGIDFEKILMDTGCLDEMFYLQDLKKRKMYLNCEITQGSVASIVRHILQFNAEDKGIAPEVRQPILLYIISEGGDVDAGFELIDAIQNSKTPVYTINLGYWYSMGFLIGLSGHKRYATKNAKFLMHDGSHFIYNSSAKARDQMRFNDRVEERVKEHVLSLSNLDGDEYDAKLRVEWYMFADEAKERGFVDYIIGEDCDIDEVI